MKRKKNSWPKPRLLFAVVVAIIGGFLFGYYTGVISGALIFLTPVFHLSSAGQGLVVSIVLIGAMIGALSGGVLADRMGRKWAMVIMACLFLVGGMVMVLAKTYEVLLLGRFLSGVGAGLTSLVTPLYLAEVSPPHYRGAFVSSYQLAVTVGILSAFLVNFLFAPTGDWRWMFGVGIFPALLLLIGLFWVLETPPWLLAHGKGEKAVEVMKSFQNDREWKGVLPSMKKKIEPHKKGEWRALFQRKFRPILLIGLILSACQQITGINAVIYYAPMIFTFAGFASTTGAILASVGLGIMNVIATLFSMWLLDHAGRRRLLLIGVAGMGLSLGVLSLAFFFHAGWTDWISVVSLVVFVASFAIGLGPVTWVVVSEIYPMKIRAKGMTVAMFTNWLSNFLVSLTFLNLVSFLGKGKVFLLFGLLGIGAFFFIFRWIPETKGRSLEEIETEEV